MKPQSKLTFREGDHPVFTFTIENVDLTGATTLELRLEAPQGLVTIPGSLGIATAQGSTATFSATGDQMQVQDNQRAVIVWVLAGVEASADEFFIDVKPKPSS